ncbi:MAG TPA: hypothetical protein PKE47_01530, partial [Verrucomicrobiota bacterium]|nr:hypothetical protein [Verrucomicrobiota bacterium]
MEDHGEKGRFPGIRRRHDRNPRPRRRCGLDGGSLILIEEDAQGIQRRTVVAVPADRLAGGVAPAA